MDVEIDQNTLKLLRRVYRLDDPRKLLAILRYYDVHLKAGESVILPWPPKREKSREMSDGLMDALIAVNRLLGLVVKSTKSGKKQTHLRYYLARNREVWRTVQVRLAALPSYHEPGGNHAANQAHERQRAEQQLDALLFSPATEHRFKNLPVSFKMTPKLEELAAELGPLFVKRVKTFLTRKIDPKILAWYAREHERLEADQSHKMKPAPLPSEVTVSQFAKAFLRKIEY